MAPGLSQPRNKIAGLVAVTQKTRPRRLERMVEGSLAEEIQDGGNVQAALEHVVAAVPSIQQREDTLDEAAEELAEATMVRSLISVQRLFST